MVTPAVVNSPNPILLVANPSNRPETLYKGQHLSSAVPLLEGNFSLRADRPETETQVISSVVDLSYAEVSDEEREQLAQLFYVFRDRISTGSYDLGSYEDSEIVIKTTTEIPPTRLRPPRIPIKFQKELDDHINKLLRAGRIVESDIPWVHNTVLVKKKDGSLRVCLDFRPLNEVTVPDHYPLPRIEDILAKIAGHRFYTTLDLASGYMQLLLSPESQEKCGWATHRGIYQFVYLPFGLKNGGAYFSRAMSRILAGLEANCLAYLDDIVIFDKDFPSHLQSLRKVFYRFRLYNIKASGKKLTEIARSHINFLEHEISGSSYSPAERNIRAIQEFPTPTTTKAVKGFVGMANFFRKFIANFALIASPLYALLNDKAKFVWEPEQEEAFQRLKLLLASKPCLAFPQDKEFFLHTDGSQHAVGAALFQNSSDTDRQLVAVGYFSKALSESQQKWSPTHIELFAIISALRFFRTTIYGNHTTIFSDHRPLTFLLKHNKTHDNLTRWVVELQSYDVTIEYLKGSSNVVADALSRAVNPRVCFEDDTPETDDIVEFPVSINKASPAIYSVRPTVCCLGPLHAIRPYDALQEQKRDRFCSALFFLIETQRSPPAISEEEKTTWLTVAEKCVIRKNGCLYYNDRQTATNPFRFERLVVPENLKEPIFLAFHTSPSSGGHFNWRKTLAKILRKYFWPHMAEDISSLVRACDSCQRKRSNMANQEALIPVVSGAIFDKVYVDLTGPLHTSEAANKYILAMIDHFSKYVIAAPLPDCTAVTVAQAIVSECILKYGVMTQLISDNASYFKGNYLNPLIVRTFPCIGYGRPKVASRPRPRVRWAMQVVFKEDNLPVEIPFIEVQHLEDTIAFRERSQQIIDQLFAGTYQNQDVADVKPSSAKEHQYVTAPPVYEGIHPVLYQVVATGWGTGVVLEAKDFFIMGPDRRDLHCITLDQFAIDVSTGDRGFNKALVSIKDFVWVYNVKPTKQALQSPTTTLQQASLPRTTALETTSIFFFRVSHFTFEAVNDRRDPSYGIALSLTTRYNKVINARAVFEGCPDAVTITPSICSFSLNNLAEYEIRDPVGSKHRLAKICNAACSALAAVNAAGDDRQTHWETATLTVPEWFPFVSK
ncbi:reverse transcriptase [Teladorsagia circumcincta]|uniref:RNA-directed DNA polymerase n=1 Tax=Teladorsagia circumcincta TaxID=45464 RepID=A0A2G9UK13_TELCI|nr:reverse transcriptase [Teladorsagia circumcincta]